MIDCLIRCGDAHALRVQVRTLLTGSPILCRWVMVASGPEDEERTAIEGNVFHDLLPSRLRIAQSFQGQPSALGLLEGIAKIEQQRQVATGTEAGLRSLFQNPNAFGAL